MSDRAVHWSITINNPKPDDDENIAVAKQKGWEVEGQKEVGENGTPHYQLYVNTRTQQRFTALKKVFPRAHIEIARNPKATKLYCHKQETRVAELPNSDKYITSQKRLWELVSDELETDRADNRHRIDYNTHLPWNDSRFDPLKAFDYACDALIRKGYHCVETMAVNPQVRSAWKTFWSAILARRELDRQTDRQDELISQSVNIPTDGEDDEGRSDSEDSGDEEEDSDGEDNEEGEGTSDGGYDESGSTGSGASDDSTE